MAVQFVARLEHDEEGDRAQRRLHAVWASRPLRNHRPGLRYGFWRGRWNTAVGRFLDCGIFEHGFARVVCPICRAEFLVAFSCKGRGLCPSWGAKRAAIFAELLQQHVLADVPHAQRMFSMPKMLRPYFLFHRELLGELSRLAFDTVLQLMAEAVDAAPVLRSKQCATASGERGFAAQDVLRRGLVSAISRRRGAFSTSSPEDMKNT